MWIDAKDGAKLHVKDMKPQSGQGEAVVLIHGWPLNGDMWEYQTVALIEAGYRVITYDRRGFGQSAHPAYGYNYDIFADDLAAVINTLDLENVTLVGFSMGGGEVARYLARHGAEKVARAVLVSAIIPYLLQDESNPDGVERAVFDTMKEQVRDDRFDFLQTFGKTFYGAGILTSPVSDGLLDWTFTLGIMASPKATLDCIDAFATTDFRRDLTAFRVPTLVIHGTADKVVPIDVSGRKAAAGIVGAQIIEYDGEPHGLFATAADRLNKDLLEFIRTEARVFTPAE